MALQFVLNSLDDLPEALKALYKKRDDGKYQLDAEGVVERAKLDEFRTNNVALAEANKDLLKKLDLYKDVDPDKYRQLVEKFHDDQEKKLIKDGNIEEVIKLRVSSVIRDRDEQLAAKEKLIADAQNAAKAALKERDDYIVKSELRRAASKPELGFHANVADLLEDGVMREFSVRDQKVVRIKPDGSVIFGKNGDPMGLEEFLTEKAKAYPHLVKPSNGGGARPANAVGAGAGKVMNRKDFDALPAGDQMAFSKSGGALVD